MKAQIKNKAPYIPKKWESVNCPFCNANVPELYERFGSELQYSYVKCGNCGLIYTNPRPAYDQDFIDAAYASYYQYADNIQVSDLDNINQSSLKMFEGILACVQMGTIEFHGWGSRIEHVEKADRLVFDLLAAAWARS